MRSVLPPVRMTQNTSNGDHLSIVEKCAYIVDTVSGPYLAFSGYADGASKAAKLYRAMIYNPNHKYWAEMGVPKRGVIKNYCKYLRRVAARKQVEKYIKEHINGIEQEIRSF